MSAMTSQITCVSFLYSAVFFRSRLKKTSKLHVKFKIQIQNSFIVRCTKYTIQKYTNIQRKAFWNNILRIWYTDMSYCRHWMWRTLLRFSKRYMRFNEWLALVRGIHRGPVDSPHKGRVTRKMFALDDVIMLTAQLLAIPLLYGM